jgi:hypothetical protein
MTEETLKQIEIIKKVALDIAQSYNANIQIQLDVNNKLKIVKVKISETIN